MPFEIPDTWSWCRLQSCCSKEIRRGKTPKYINNSSVLVFAQKCNTKYDGINIDLALFLDESTLSKYSDEEYIEDKDTVINSTGNGTLGRVGFYQIDNNHSNLPIVPDSHVTIIRPYNKLNKIYVNLFCKAIQPELEKMGKGSTNQKELKPVTLKEMLIPMPPIKEQEVIVKQIGDLFSVLDNIEGAVALSSQKKKPGSPKGLPG